MKTEKILLSKNTEIGMAAIATFEKNAKEASEIIQYFNGINLLNPITTEIQVLEFLKDTVKYLDDRISSDLEFKAKVQPLPAKNAEMFGINYKGIAEKIAACKLRDLKNMIFDEKTQAVEFDKSCTKKVLEFFYDYSANEKETNEIIKIRTLCKNLNEYCTRYKINSSDMHLISDRLGLRCEIIPGAKQNDPGNHYEFKENITVLRSTLEYENTHGSQ